MKAQKTGADIAAMQGDYPLAKTLATRMLSAALEQANKDKGWSQRNIAKMLGYRSSVALSHMALGRVPIPVERSADFARLLKMDAGEFLVAVLEQRYPEIDVRRILAATISKTGKSPPQSKEGGFLVRELEDIAKQPLDDLPTKIVNVLRNVVADPNGDRRMISMSEVPFVETLRRVHPDGLTPAQSKKLTDAIESL